MGRKVFIAATIGMLVFSLVAASAEPGKATIHIQTFGYEGKDLLKLTVEVTGEDSDYVFITVDSVVLKKIAKEINVEKLPVIQISDTTFGIPKNYLTEIGENEYVIVVPNDVAKMKWSIKDKIKDMKGKDSVRVLVWFKESDSFTVLNKYGNVYYKFLSGMGAAVDVHVSDIKALSEEASIAFVEADAEVRVLLSQSVPLINADDVWGLGYDGADIKICIIDTGIDPDHCDFPSGKIVGWVDYVNNCAIPYDDHGHGTHCASIAAGQSAPKGVAPGASLMGAKVLDSSGSGSWTQVIQGIDWGVANGADVESMSLGGTGGDGTSSVAQESNWAWDQGVIVVIAAGNSGSACCTIGTPGDAAKPITVGASDKSDALASFSSRGPTTDGRVKPDITAPGVSIYAASICTSCSDVSMSGTSMATPHMAGVCALMHQANPSATNNQIKNCIGKTAIDKGNTGKDCLWGWGRVDALASVNQVKNNPGVSPPGNASDCGCTCGGGSLSFSPLSPSIPLFSSSIVITNPMDGEEVCGTVEITTCRKGCFDTVEFYIDGELKDTVTSWPFQYLWDTSEETDGIHTITVKGYRSGQFIDSDEITVLVNGCIAITNPHNGETVSCKVLITTCASEEVQAVKFIINGKVKDTVTSRPFQYLWDTCEKPNGSYTIRVEAYGDQVLTGSTGVLDVLICFDEITVQVNNPCIEITVQIEVDNTYVQDGGDVYDTAIITTNESCCIDEVRFYIDDELKCTEFGSDYKYEWDTTDPEYIEDQAYIITVEGYYNGVLKCTDSITVTVDNYEVEITSPQDGGDVSGTVYITVDTRGIDIVQLCIGGNWYCPCIDCEAPFEFEWDTTGYGEDEQYELWVYGFTNDQIPNCISNCPELFGSYSEQPKISSIVPKAIHHITVTVNNIYVKITDPHEGDEVSGTFLITTDAKGIDTVKFYIDDINNPCECEDTSEPFECNWDTTKYGDGDHTVIARGYASGELQDEDTVTCKICNGSAALCLGILLGCVGITIRRR